MCGEEGNHDIGTQIQPTVLPIWDNGARSQVWLWKLNPGWLWPFCCPPGSFSRSLAWRHLPWHSSLQGTISKAAGHMRRESVSKMHSFNAPWYQTTLTSLIKGCPLLHLWCPAGRISLTMCGYGESRSSVDDYFKTFSADYFICWWNIPTPKSHLTLCF